MAINSNLMLEDIFNEIKTGMRCVLVNGRTFFFKFPSAEIISNGQLYEKELIMQYKDKLPTSDELTKRFLRGRNIPALEYLEEEKSITEQVIKAFKSRGRKPGDETYDSYIRKLADIEEQLQRLAEVKEVRRAAIKFSLDVKIKENVYTYYLTQCTLIKKPLIKVNHQDHKREWVRSFGDSSKVEFVNYFDTANFESESERSKIIGLLFPHFVNFLAGWSDSDLRQVAKSPTIMNLFKISNNNSTPFFPGTASDYTTVQTQLLFWLNYYHSVFTNLGAPDKHIIENDSEFDRWVQNKIEEQKTDNSGSRNSKGSSDSKNVHKIRFKRPTRAAAY